jgi:hypothetical protein
MLFSKTHLPVLWPPRDVVCYFEIPAESGDTCDSLSSSCGISLQDFVDINPVSPAPGHSRSASHTALSANACLDRLVRPPRRHQPLPLNRSPPLRHNLPPLLLRRPTPLRCLASFRHVTASTRYNLVPRVRPSLQKKKIGRLLHLHSRTWRRSSPDEHHVCTSAHRLTHLTRCREQLQRMV